MTTWRLGSWLWGLALTVLASMVVALAVDNNRNDAATFVLPPLKTENIDDQPKPVIDFIALTEFTRQHQLPDLPDLNRVSVEAARDIHLALAGVSSSPHDDESIGQLGRTLQSHQYASMAMESYVRAQSLDPTAFEWPYYIGRLHADAFEIEPAIESYEKAARLNPSYASTFLSLGKLYRQNNDSENARKAYRKFITLRPDSSHGYLGLAQIAFDQQEFDKTIVLLNDAIDQDPEDFRVQNLMGQTYQQLGQPAKASKHLAIVKNLEKRSERAKHVFFDDPLYHQMLASNSSDTAISERLRAALSARQTDVAIRLAKQLWQRHPDDAAQLHSLALAYKQGKRYKEALACTEKSIKLAPDRVETQAMKAQLLLIFRRNIEALELLRTIASKEPDSFDVYYYLGVAQVLSHQYEAAIVSFRRAVDLDNRSARARVALAEALGMTGQHDESIAEYRRALAVDPTNARAIQRLQRDNN